MNKVTIKNIFCNVTYSDEVGGLRVRLPKNWLEIK